MSERQPGWYWVKTCVPGRDPRVDWDCLRWWVEDEEDRAWISAGCIEFFGDVIEIGPRIPTPDEPWQTVPAVPTDDMMHAGCEATGDCERLGECHLDCHCSPAPKVFRAMLAVAPKPGD